MYETTLKNCSGKKLLSTRKQLPLQAEYYYLLNTESFLSSFPVPYKQFHILARMTGISGKSVSVLSQSTCHPASGYICASL